MTVFNFDHAIAKARLLDAKMKEIEDRQKAELAPYVEARGKLRGALLEMLIKTGQQNCATPSGGCHRISRVTFSLEDPDEFMRHVIGTESFHMLDRKVNKLAAEDYLKENRALPPGVKRSELLELGVTAPVKRTPRQPTSVSKPTAEAAPIIEAIKDSVWSEAERLADEELATEAQYQEGEATAEETL